jgi:hypothetical protein
MPSGVLFVQQAFRCFYRFWFRRVKSKTMEKKHLTELSVNRLGTRYFLHFFFCPCNQAGEMSPDDNDDSGEADEGVVKHTVVDIILRSCSLCA